MLSIMKVLWILMAVAGVWFLASAATDEGLLPSGHGLGRWSEVVAGIALVGYSVYGLWRGNGHAKN